MWWVWLDVSYETTASSISMCTWRFRDRRPFHTVREEGRGSEGKRRDEREREGGREEGDEREGEGRWEGKCRYTQS